MDSPLERETYMRAASIADVLLSQGVPLIKFDTDDAGHRVVFSFQRANDPAKYMLSMSVEEASVEAVRDAWKSLR